MIKCCICGQTTVKYEMDAEDTVCLEIRGKLKWVCDDCAKEIAIQRISR